MEIISAWKNLTSSKLKKSEANFEQKNRKQGQLLSESGFVLCIAPSSLSRDRRIKIKKLSHQGRSSCTKTLSIFSHFSACYFLIKNVLCSELIICCYHMDIKISSPQSYMRLRADSKDKANVLMPATKSDDSNNID